MLRFSDEQIEVLTVYSASRTICARHSKCEYGSQGLSNHATRERQEQQSYHFGWKNDCKFWSRKLDSQCTNVRRLSGTWRDVVLQPGQGLFALADTKFSRVTHRVQVYPGQRVWRHVVTFGFVVDSALAATVRTQYNSPFLVMSSTMKV